MKQHLITFFQAITIFHNSLEVDDRQADLIGLTFPSFQPYWQHSADLSSLTDNEALDLGGNLLIDYNDSADHDSTIHNQIWDTWLAPIDAMYLAARPEHTAKTEPKQHI